MNLKNLANSFKLNNQLTFDQQVHPITAIQPNPFVVNRDWLLRCKAKSRPRKFMRQTPFAGRFEQPRTKLTMDLNRTPNNFI